MKDAHDPREFRQWVSLDAAGNVTAVYEFVSTHEQPLPEIVEVTKLAPWNWATADHDTMAPIRLEHSILVAESAATEMIAAEKASGMK